MRFKSFLTVFALGAAVGAGGMWFGLQQPEKRDAIIEQAKEQISQVASQAKQQTVKIDIPSVVGNGGGDQRLLLWGRVGKVVID